MESIRNIIKLDSVDSTNDYLHRLLNSDKPDNLTVVVAMEQTKGRGQRDSNWESEYGKNLIFSLLYFPKKMLAANQVILLQAIAIAVSNVFENEAGEGFLIKWPNDIYFNDFKVGGLLIENNIMDDFITSAIIGIGLNINQQEFSSNAPNPKSLIQITGRTFNIDHLLNETLTSIGIQLNEIEEENFEFIRDAYHHKLYRINEWHYFEAAGERFKACIKGVTESGELLVMLENGQEKKFFFKEIVYI